MYSFTIVVIFFLHITNGNVIPLNQRSLENSTNSENEKDYCECGISNRFGTRIVGGERTSIVKYPWMVGLSIYNFQSCGAALLNGCFLITAAHCVKKIKRPSQLTGIVGAELRHDFKASKTKVVEIIRHPNYKPNDTHDDIALLRISPPVVYSDRIHPICLPKRGIDYLNRSATVIGFGYTNEKGSASNSLREVDVKVTNQNECAKVFKDQGDIYPNNLCAGGEEGKDACLGDSGGPLILQDGDTGRFEIIGVVSWGVGCAREGVPGVYTQVNRYLDWIEKTIDQKDCCHPDPAVRETKHKNRFWFWK